MKKLNEVKVGDTLYCIAYGLDGNGSMKIVPITVKEVITNGPIIDRQIYFKEAIVIKEKVPNSPEAEGEYVIDQYYRGDECQSYSHGIYTTFEEAQKDALKELQERLKHVNSDMRELAVRLQNIMKSYEIIKS